MVSASFGMRAEVNLVADLSPKAHIQLIRRQETQERPDDTFCFIDIVSPDKSGTAVTKCRCNTITKSSDLAYMANTGPRHRCYSTAATARMTPLASPSASRHTLLFVHTRTCRNSRWRQRVRRLGAHRRCRVAVNDARWSEVRKPYLKAPLSNTNWSSVRSTCMRVPGIVTSAQPRAQPCWFSLVFIGSLETRQPS
jgi:hypothetical protein